jgi:hypothetical protein
MRIRTTTGPGASPPPGVNKNSDHQTRPGQIGTSIVGISVADGRAGMQPLQLVVSITAITSTPCGGGQW